MTEHSARPNDLRPRSDVASGGLGGALTVLLMLALGNQEFDADAVGAAVAVVLTFAGGYLPKNYKPLWTTVVAPFAALITTFVGAAFFGVPAGQLAVSTALSSIVVALFTYVVPPYSASELDNVK
jgi:hypothetical protein